MDRNPKMVGMTHRNLEHFGYQADMQRGDACQCTCTADAVVTDLPYGRFLKPDEPNVRAILHQMASQVPLGIYSMDRDISPWLKEAGYQKIDVFRITKRAGFTRYIHRAHITGMQE
jgi:tRNA G10  N-methylase Trm11